jgi:four helix bundle protein
MENNRRGHNFRKLQIWEASKLLVKDIYLLTKNLPSVSIPSNIAEGAGRGSDKDFSRFLDIALGSAYELETQLHLCFDLSFISQHELDDILNLLNPIQKQIYNFKRKLNG